MVNHPKGIFDCFQEKKSNGRMENLNLVPSQPTKAFKAVHLEPLSHPDTIGSCNVSW